MRRAFWQNTALYDAERSLRGVLIDLLVHYGPPEAVREAVDRHLSEILDEGCDPFADWDKRRQAELVTKYDQMMRELADGRVLDYTLTHAPITRRSWSSTSLGSRRSASTGSVTAGWPMGGSRPSPTMTS